MLGRTLLVSFAWLLVGSSQFAKADKFRPLLSVNAADRDGNDALDREELIAFVIDSQKSLFIDLADRLFLKFDINLDGMATRDEAKKAGDYDFSTFQDANTDGDDTISRSDVRTLYIKRLRARQESIVSRLLMRGDQNGDGLLTQDELSAVLKTRSN